MKKLFDENKLLLKPPKIGEIVEGKIIAKERGSVFLDLGPIGTGIIYGAELYAGKDILKDLKIGESVLVKIVEPKNEEGYIELSIAQASKEITWEELKQKKQKGEIMKVKITGVNKGGLLTEISGIQAFLPVSQLSANNYPKVGGDTTKILKELQKFIGKEMEVQIFDLDPKSGKLILSEKLKESEKIREYLKNYKAGDIVEGEITGIVDFGVFVKFDKTFDLEGLIHISELDWKIVEVPSKVVNVGQKVQAKIINIVGEKVFLSLKALKKDPWEGLEKKYKKGDVVSGKVIKLNPFGAFVQIENDIQGLCHISEFGSFKKMEEKLKIDKEYDFKILEIQPLEHKINLELLET